MSAILILHAVATDAIWAMRVAIRVVVQKLKFTGHLGEGLRLKTDHEEAIVALKKTVAPRIARATMVHSQVRVSRTKPRVERAVGKWRSQFHKLRLHLEDRVVKRVSQHHPMVSWMVGWASEVMLQHEVHSHGRARYEGITGLRVRHNALRFGERFHFMVARDDSGLVNAW